MPTTRLRLTKRDYVRYRDTAEAFVERKVHELNRQYGFTIGRITVRNQKTRWGSCSRKGNLNFNYKLLLIPERLADYVIVHEICHIGEFNHSRKFWDLVWQAIPDYAERRAELRKIGGIL
jgi:predicted metal-dependent hydrolase